MSLAILNSRANIGIAAPPVAVEVHISNGLPRFSIVGLPETVVKESKDRVRSALLHSRFEFPSRRITVNLAPADLPKEGGRFDLPIALGILAATKQLPKEHLANYEFAGELALSGELRPIQGALPFALGTCQTNRTLILPRDNADEATLPKNIEVLAATHLLDVCQHLHGKNILLPHPRRPLSHNNITLPDLADIRGQYHARRTLEIAATGNHSLLMVGPPGTGKTMLATRLPSILPPMTTEEALETAAIVSITDVGFKSQNWRRRPFRSPHHSASSVALVGGGSLPRPGEISLAHHGVLFLDELPEFNRHVLESLREPLETGNITISRAARHSLFPAQFQLICAMNPCPCGYLGDPRADCHCSPDQIKRYQHRLSGPFLDRIDIQIEVPPLSSKLLIGQQKKTVENSKQVRERVTAARTVQNERQKKPNTQLSTQEISEHCHINTKTQQLLENAMQEFSLSARAYHRILKVARTIADLDKSDPIQIEHLAEAISYRKFTRK